VLRKKKSKSDEKHHDDVIRVEIGEPEPPASGDAIPSDFWERLTAAGQEYVRELEEVAKEVLDGLRAEQEKLQQQIGEITGRVREAEAKVAAALAQYAEALQVSDGGALPGSHDALRKTYEHYASAHARLLDAATAADAEIARQVAHYAEREAQARTSAKERFAKAFNTYTLAQSRVWTSADPDTVDPGTLMAAAQEIYAVAAYAAATAAAP
jgi:hypothetical protein